MGRLTPLAHQDVLVFVLWGRDRRVSLWWYSVFSQRFDRFIWGRVDRVLYRVIRGYLLFGTSHPGIDRPASA